MKWMLILMIGMTLVPGVSAGEEKRAAIEKTINHYFEGYSTGNVELLKKAFRQDTVIKYIAPWNGKYSELTMAQLNDFMTKLPENWQVNSRIDSIDIHGTMASAKVTVEVVGQITWTDFIHLMEIDGSWWIINKISHGKRAKS